MEAREMFSAALLHMVEMTKQFSQKQISEASGIAPQTISNIVRGNKEAGLSSQERIAAACGFSLLDFLSLGRDLLEGRSPAQEESAPAAKPRQEPSILAEPKASAATSAIASVTALVDEIRHLEQTVRFWQMAFESMPDPMWIVKNGIVVRQNQKSKAWGILTGSPLCHNCVDGKCDMTCAGDICAIKQSQEHGILARRFKETQWGRALVSCAPMLVDGQEYYIVTATLMEEHPVRNFGNNHLAQ